MNRTAVNLGDIPDKNNGPTCPYCGSGSRFVHCSQVGIRDHDYFVWVCHNYPTCNAYVGAHQTGIYMGYPLGRLADAELRKAKRQAHSVFDLIWKRGYMQRGAAYKWMQEQMNIEDMLDCHIGEMTPEQCYKLYSLCVTYLQNAEVYE